MTSPAHDPELSPPFDPVADPAAEAGCPEFEGTLLLLDGALDGAPLARARAHADACALCGPMVAGWPALGRALSARFDDAAERAKPELVRLTDAVMRRTGPADRVEAAPGRLDAVWQAIRRYQPHVAFAAAAAAIALAVLPLATTPVSTGPAPGVAVTAPVAPPPVGETPDRPVVVLRGVTFQNDAEGMVYRTPRGGMTILWVVEKEDA